MKPKQDTTEYVKGMHVEMMCDDGTLHARWPDNAGGNVEIGLEISDAEALIALAQDAIATWRKEQN